MSKIIDVVGQDKKIIQIDEKDLSAYSKKGFERTFDLIDTEGNSVAVPLSSLSWAKSQGFKLDKSSPQLDISKMESAGRGFLKELSMGLADEGAAVWNSATSDQTYTQAKETWQNKDALADLANPKSYTTGQGLGIAAGVALPMGAAGKGLSKAVQTGAALGAVQGFGEGEGLSDSLKGAAKGAAVGGAGGAVVHGAAVGVSKAAQKLGEVASKVKANLPAMGEKAADALGKAAKLGGQDEIANAAYQKFLKNPRLLKEAEDAAKNFSEKLPLLTKKAQGFADDIAEATGKHFEDNFLKTLGNFTKAESAVVKQALADAMMTVKGSTPEFNRDTRNVLASIFASKEKGGKYAFEARRKIDEVLFKNGDANPNLGFKDRDLLIGFRNKIQEVMHSEESRSIADKLFSDFSDVWSSGLKKELVDRSSGKVAASKVETLLNPKRQSDGRALDIQNKWDELEKFLEENADKLPTNIKDKFIDFKSEKNPLRLLKEYNKIKGQGGETTGRSQSALLTGSITGSPLIGAASMAVFNPQQILSLQQGAMKIGDAVRNSGVVGKVTEKADVIKKLMARGFSEQQAIRLASKIGQNLMRDD